MTLPIFYTPTYKERYPDDKFRFFFKYDSFERENLQYKVGNNFIGGDSLFCPTGGVKKIVFLAIAPYRVVFSKSFSVNIEAINNNFQLA